MAFWFFSMGGGLMTLVYGIVKREPVIILGQALATVIYIRNIISDREEPRAWIEDAGPLAARRR